MQIILRWSAAVVAGIVLTAAAPIESRAQDESDDPRIARLIRNLGSSSFSVRSRAAEELEELGPLTKQQLEAAAASTNFEVRQRAKRLLTKIKTEELWDPRKVTLKVENAETVDVINELSRQTTNRIAAGDQYGTFDNKRVTLSLDRIPFWNALDELCRKSGNHVRPHYDVRKTGLVVVSGEAGQYPVAFAGPVRGAIVSARRVFIEEVDYETGHSDVTHTFQFSLRMQWEDRFQLAAYRTELEFVEAIADNDDRIAAANPRTGEWKSTGHNTREVALSLRIHPPPAEARQIDVLRVKWGLVAVGDHSTLEIREFTSPGEYSLDDGRLKIAAAETLEDGRVKLTLIVNRDLPSPQPHEVLYHENQVEVVDENGRPFRTHVHTRRLTPEGLQIEATFSPEAAGSEAARLRFTYPRIRSQRDLEVVFRDVSLPLARPE